MSTIENLKSFGKRPLFSARLATTWSPTLARDDYETIRTVESRRRGLLPCCWSSQRNLSFHSTGQLLTSNLDPFAEADDDQGVAQKKQGQDYIHIRIQQRNGRKTLTTVQGLPKKFDQKKILKVIKKKFACNGTIVADSEMGEVIQLQGDQRKDVQEFLVAKDGLELDAKTIKVSPARHLHPRARPLTLRPGSRFLDTSACIPGYHARTWKTDRSCRLATASILLYDFFLPTTFMTVTSR